MKITIEVECTEEEYKEAVADGWNECYSENIKPNDVQSLDNPSDFQLAAAYLPSGSFKSMKYTLAKGDAK